MSYALQKLLNPHLHDLNPILTGEAACPPGEVHPFSSNISNCTIIHYIRKGCGKFYARGNTYTVTAGQAFLILPGEDVSYVADEKDPWVYAWVGFTGALSGKFSSLPPVFDVPDDMLPHLRSSFDWENMDEYWGYALATDLLLFYAKILRPQAKKPDYIQEILDHVRLFYMEKLSVVDFARQYGLDRRYLSRKFKKKIGMTIQDYILNVRMYEGCRYLRMGYSVKETATLCGYSSASIFSKLFKWEHGFSPTEWRQQVDRNVLVQIDLMEQNQIN